MANKKISQLQTVSELDGTEVLPIVQSGTTKKVTAQAIADLGGGGGGGVPPIEIQADGTIATYAQNIGIRQSAPISTASGNQTVTVITYPEIYLSQGTSTYLNFPTLEMVGMSIYGFNNLTQVSFPALTTVVGGGMAALSINQCPALTTILLPALTTLTSQNMSFGFYNNALSQENVDYILDKLISTGMTNCSIQLYGGTNAAPSAAGLASKNILVSRGWSVQHN